MPNDDMKIAVLVMPALIALGQLPRQAGNADDAWIQNTGDQFHNHMKRREAAAAAFVKAKKSRPLRAALLARGAPMRDEYFVGECVYHWRQERDAHRQEGHWRGQALIALIDRVLQHRHRMSIGLSESRVLYGGLRNNYVQN